ncbi:MAG: DNA mismatch repair protein MutT [Clostridiales bacterium]|nr:MAG: DNA mismatch repair protein MutT [Clostridiales bacterium]
MVKATHAYIRKDNKTLFLLRNKKEKDVHEGKYIGVGGKMEKNETPDECIDREIFEETGLKVISKKLRGKIFFPEFDGENDILMYTYTVDKFEGELSECNEGSLEWVDDKDMFRLPMWQGDPVFLKWIYEGSEYFEATFNYVDGKFIDYSVEKGDVE